MSYWPRMAVSNSPTIEKTPNNSARKPVEQRSQFRTALWAVFVLLVLVFLGYNYLIGQVDEKLTNEILTRVQKHFPKHVVSLERATLNPGVSIVLEGLTLKKPTSSGPRPVLKLQRAECFGPIDLLSLAQGQLVVNNVDLDGVELFVWPHADGTWNLQELSKNEPIPESFPNISVRSGLIRLGCEPGREAREIVCHDLRAQIGLKPRLIGEQLLPLELAIQASIASSYFKEFQVQATLDERKTKWNASGSLKQLEFSSQLVAQLPELIRRHLKTLDGLSGELNVQFQADQIAHGLNYNVQGQISQARWNRAEIPFAMEGIQGNLFCQNGELRIRNFAASSGAARIQGDLDWHGMKLDSPMQLSLQVNNLELDQRLYHSLPQGVQAIWNKIRPNGWIDAQARIGFDGTRWNPMVSVQARQCTVNADYFPYPIDSIFGSFEYADGIINAPAIEGLANGIPVSGALRLERASPRWLMDFDVKSHGPIPIDETLIRALTPRGQMAGAQQKFIRDLHPQGTVHLKSGQFRRTADNPDVLSRRLELTFSACSIKYDQFRYPIVDINGEAIVDNGFLTLRDFVGRNDGARINANGLCYGSDSRLESLALEFTAFDVPLDEELQQALPSGVRSLWDEIRPTGSMDRVKVSVTQHFHGEPLDIQVEMKETSDPNGNVGRAVAFRPASLPYSIHDVACDIRYRPGRIDIVQLSGSHDASRLLSTGQFALHSNGSWDGTLQWLETTRFLVDQNLLKSLPAYVREPMMRLDFRGPISVTGSTQIASPRTEGESVIRSWDLDLQVEEGRLGGGGIASGIRGALTLQGQNTNEGPIAYGHLDLDALAVKGVAVTGVKGPYALTSRELYFGRDAVDWQRRVNINDTRRRPLYSVVDEQIASAVHFSEAKMNSTVGYGSEQSQVVQAGAIRDNLQSRLDARFATLNQNSTTMTAESWTPPQRDMPTLDLSEHDVRARALSGTVFLSGVEPLNFDVGQAGANRARYKLRLVDSHLQDCMLDLGEPSSTVNGRLSVQCDVIGSITNLSSIEGTGNAWLREAKLYELPVMIRLFRLLSVRPDQGAFDAADISFGIDGEKYPIHELLLDGDLVSMKGSGWINLRREMQLDLQANVSRRNIVGAMINPLAPNNSANLLRFEVTGTASDPQVKRSTLMNSWESVNTETR